MAKKLVIFKLGSVERGFIPPRRWYQDFSKLIEKAIQDDAVTSFIVSHPFVTVVTVDVPEGARVVTPDEPLEGDLTPIAPEPTPPWWKRKVTVSRMLIWVWTAWMAAITLLVAWVISR